jgi:hypothetical protein
MEKTTSIKFFWNGMKVNGNKELIKCRFSMYDEDDQVTIWAEDYGNAIPADIFSVDNETDIYTDYFDKDSAVVEPDHPLYAYARAAALSAKLHDEEGCIRYWKKRIANYGTHKRDRYESAEYMRNNIKEYEARAEELRAKLADLPKNQPTAADVEKCHARREAAAAAAREKEMREELERRAAFEKKRDEGTAFIKSTMESCPIKAGEPVVRIHWSEHPAFYAWADDELVLSLTAAETILKTFDEQEVAERAENGGYYKTKLSIEEGENVLYGGCRYDLGDGDGGLFEHIRSFGKFIAENGQFGNGKPTADDITEGEEIMALADRLESYTGKSVITSVQLAPYLPEILEEINKKAERLKQENERKLDAFSDDAIEQMAIYAESQGRPDAAANLRAFIGERRRRRNPSRDP